MTRWWLLAGLIFTPICLAACADDDDTGGAGGHTTATAAPSGSGGTHSGTATGQAGGAPGGSHTGGSAAGGGGAGSGAGGQGGEGAGAQACGEPNPLGEEIVELVNAYRQANGKPTIPYSPSLSCVAVTHVHDLYDNQPHASANCNLHSWSDQGPWTPCCYTPDHAEAQCMWDKPRELTVYSGNGYENAAGGVSTPAQAVSMWQNSPAHDAVMLNEGTWASHPWHAVGAGLYQGYAALWFGEQSDPAN